MYADVLMSQASQNASSRLHSDVSKGFVVGGVSAGATMAAATAHTWKLEGRIPPITGSFMSLTILDNAALINGVVSPLPHDEYRSMSENAEAPVLNKDLSERFWDIYNRDLADPLCNPLLFESFYGLPRTYVQTCGLDPYRDGNLIYQRRVLEAGGKLVLICMRVSRTHFGRCIPSSLQQNVGSATALQARLGFCLRNII